MFILAEGLCRKLYDSAAAGEYLRLYALLVPMLYCDAIIDAMNKGLGQQKVCVAINIFTAVLDVVVLYLLLPQYGMWGYFLSFLLSHLVNACLSVCLLLRTAKLRFPLHTLTMAALALAGALTFAGMVEHLAAKTVVFLVLILVFLWFFGVVCREDLLWLKGLPDLQKNSNKIENSI